MIHLQNITKTYAMGLSGRPSYARRAYSAEVASATKAGSRLREGGSAPAKTEEVAVHALRGVSLTIGAGEFVAIMGPSGSP